MTAVYFFNDTATPEIYTLSLHDALPIYVRAAHDVEGALRGSTGAEPVGGVGEPVEVQRPCHPDEDRKSTRLNSSHANISYAVFCLKKKKTTLSKYTLAHHAYDYHATRYS